MSKYLALGLVLISLSQVVRARQVPTLAFSSPTEPAIPGGSVLLSLNALNISSNLILWEFPATIVSSITSSERVFDRTLELQSDESLAVTISPGGFAHKEYRLLVPNSVTGQVIVRFPKLNANPVVLSVSLVPVTVAAPPDHKGSLFNKLITEAEPEKPGESFEPGRFFKEHISGYEPFYFVVGPDSPNARFQISFKYRLLNTEGPLAERFPVLEGFHLAYTQTSLWNLSGSDPSFFDTTYRPEFLYAWDRVVGGKPRNWFRLDLQAGLQHDSNGRGGAEERSFNIAYLRPTLTFGRDDGLQLLLQPQAWLYVGNLYHNPDMPDYLGYAGMRAILGWRRGLQLSAVGRIGQQGENGSLQLDLTYPTMRLFGSFSLYLDVQYFTGYGESLLGYDQKTQQIRFGFALFR